MSGPLTGVCVLDLTENVLGPLATQILGDAGAEVIKVESPAGDPTRSVGPSSSMQMGSLFLGVNRNKKSVVLNLKDPVDHKRLLNLIPQTDVFVHCMRPGAARRLGLDYHSIRTLNRSLIYGSASGYRTESGLADAPAYDDVIQGRSGLAAINADHTGNPRYLPTVHVDKLCGLHLAVALSLALFHRERTGVGQEVHVPMFDTMVAFNFVEHLWGATFPERQLSPGYTRALSPHRRPYRTRDGYICLLAINDRQWQRLLRAIEREDLLADPRFSSLASRTENINPLYEELARTVSGYATHELQERLDAAEIPNGPMNSLDDVLEDPYVRSVELLRDFEHSTEGRLRLPWPPVAFSETPQDIARLPPKLGEHTRAVLSERDADSP